MNRSTQHHINAQNEQSDTTTLQTGEEAKAGVVQFSWPVCCLRKDDRADTTYYDTNKE